MSEAALANPLRGEASFPVAGRACRLRPSYAALVAAEDELGPLIALAERAAGGGLRIAEIATLFWHCVPGEDRPSREAVGEAVVTQGLAATAAPLRTLLTEILKGTG